MLNAGGGGGGGVTGITTIDNVTVWLCTGDPESETVTANVAVPLVVGVPEMTPPAESVRPVGRLPDVIDQVYPGVPPLADIAAVYAVPPCAPGSPDVLIDSDDCCDGLVTVRGTSFDDPPFAFFTRNCATAGCASELPLIFADSVVELTMVVGIALPFTVTDDCDSKFCPWTVTVTLGVPAVTTCGDTWLMVGLTSATTVTPVPQPQQARLIPSPRAIAFKKSFIRSPKAKNPPRRREAELHVAKEQAQYTKGEPCSSLPRQPPPPPTRGVLHAALPLQLPIDFGAVL